jgi:glycosyltransferase involved in cell wall biosynthesis
MKPLVSVLIPAYNAERFLAETMRSALAQTWQAKEIIVVDDGSRDGTLAIARSFEALGVKVIAQENRGQCAARNAAVAASQGELLEFLDADDLLQPDKLEVQIRRLQEEGFDCVTSGHWERFYKTPGDGCFLPEPMWTDLDPVDWLVSAWERQRMMHPAAWLVPRTVADRAGPWDESLSLIDDFEYFARVVLACRRVLFCPDAMSWYRSGIQGSMSGSKSRKAWESASRALHAGTAQLLAREDSPRTRRACVRCFQEFQFSAYPDCPDLMSLAEQRIAELGGGRLPPRGGTAFRLISSVFGWRTAKTVQRLAHRLRPVNSVPAG